MKLFLTDYHLQAAHLCRDEGNHQDADAHLHQAAQLIRETGYKRRLTELAGISQN